MRVLNVAQFYPPIIGGEERFVRDFSAALAARGHDVAVATLRQEGMVAFEQDGPVRVHRLPSTLARASFLHGSHGRRHAPPFPDPETTLALRRVIAAERPQIVHAHNWMIHSFLPIKALAGAKLVLTLHDYSMRCVTKRLLYRGARCSGPGPIKCLGCAAAHHGAAVGVPTTLANWGMGAVERKLVDLFLPESNAVAEGNGLVGGRWPYEVIPVFAPDDIGAVHGDADPYVAQLPAEPFLLFVGAFASYKGVDVLLEAYRGLVAPPPLVIIGYHTTEYPVATTDLPPNVTVLENWPHHAVMAAWARSLIGIVPSVWAEPFGLVVLEAMAAGRPVIASAIGGPADIVRDEETGLLVPPGDPLALRVALARLIADAALGVRLGAAGQCRVNEFKAAAVLPRIERAYRALLTGDRTTQQQTRLADEDARVLS